MPGRQAHGRSLVAAPKPKNAKKSSKARSQKNALNAFGIAQENFPSQQKRTPRVRELDAEIERKHGRDEDDDEAEDDEDEAPRKKKAKGPAGGDADYGSDSEGNEWQLGGMAEDDEDSEIESDDAFGDSDEEKFAGYSFSGSKAPKAEDDDSEDDSNDDEGETLGEEAIDLATALDQFEEESDEEPEGDSESGSEGSEDEATDDSELSEGSDEEDDEVADPERLEALRGIISGYGGEKEDDTHLKPTSKQKIELSDLGLSGLKDPLIKKAVNLMNKEEKEKRPGATKKLDVPLSRREQGRIDRTVAYDKTNETLDRWTDTVKHNRRAEHLVFPLPQNSATAGLDRTEIQPLTAKNTSNELESTIMSIMEQSGLSMEKQKSKKAEYDEEGNELSRREIMARKRMERELNSRETKRASRIKKIKSKAYHRVHRRQRERDEMATREAMEEAGEIDSEEEREAQDRRRALERVGQRHKESKWAKLGSKAKRAVWDEDFRAGLTEMARKDEELRRRKEGKTAESDSDATSSSGSDSEDDAAALRRDLDRLDQDDEEAPTGIMGMKFMQKAEAAKRKANDEMVSQIRRDLDGEEGPASDEEVGEVGRRQYGNSATKVTAPALDTSGRAPKKGRSRDADGVSAPNALSSKGQKEAAASDGAWVTSTDTVASTGGAWSHGEVRRKKKGSSSARVDDLDLSSNVMVASRPAKPKPATNSAQGEDDDSDSDSDQHLPMAIRDQDLIARAFAGEDVVGQFEREKEEITKDDDDKVIDNTLPGWGSWVGEGVSKREKSRHQGRFLTKVEGIKKKDRKDAKLDKVIINEKRIKKNDRYLASQLPHPFESQQQYERSLRVPVGPEWTTKETFQDGTKPRVLMKQGIITPIAKPVL